MKFFKNPKTLNKFSMETKKINKILDIIKKYKNQNKSVRNRMPRGRTFKLLQN